MARIKERLEVQLSKDIVAHVDMHNVQIEGLGTCRGTSDTVILRIGVDALLDLAEEVKGLRSRARDRDARFVGSSGKD